MIRATPILKLERKFIRFRCSRCGGSWSHKIGGGEGGADRFVSYWKVNIARMLLSGREVAESSRPRCFRVLNSLETCGESGAKVLMTSFLSCLTIALPLLFPARVNHAALVAPVGVPRTIPVWWQTFTCSVTDFNLLPSHEYSKSSTIVSLLSFTHQQNTWPGTLE